MVGIAGRSKACGLCYQRRIKCDATRPTCERCRKSKRECPGYRDTTFLSFQAGPQGLRRLQDDAVGEQPEQASSPSTIGFSGTLYQPTIRPQDEDFVMYSRVHLPSHWNEDSKWRPVDLSHASLTHNVLQFALIALARTLFGYHHCSRDLIVQGLNSYGKVLSNTQRLLEDSETAVRMDVLETILALRAFDSFMPFQPRAWIQHSIGVESLLKRAGPSHFICSDSQRLLEYSRPQIIMACLALGKSTILAEKQWKTIPWSQHPSHDPANKALVDIFVDLPTLAWYRTSNGTKKSNQHGDNSLISALTLAIFRRLHGWLVDWSHIQSPDHIKAPSPAPHHTTFPPATFARTYPYRLDTRTLMLYSAISLLTLDKAFRPGLQALHCTRCLQQYTTSPLSPASLISEDAQVLDSVDVAQLYHHALAEACRAITYYFNCKRHEVRLIELLIPLRQVWIVTRGLDCPMATWLDEYLRKISKQPMSGVPLLVYAK